MKDLGRFEPTHTSEPRGVEEVGCNISSSAQTVSHTTAKVKAKMKVTCLKADGRAVSQSAPPPCPLATLAKDNMRFVHS